MRCVDYSLRAVAATLVFIACWIGTLRAEPLAIEGLRMESTGALHFDDTEITVVCREGGTRRVDLASLKAEKGFPKETATAWETRGELTLTKGSVAWTETIGKTGDAEFALSVQGAASVPLESSSPWVLEIVLPVERAAGKTLSIDGQSFPLPDEYHTTNVFGKKVKSLRFPSASGTVTVTLHDDAFLNIQDGRGWKAKEFQLRVSLPRQDATIGRAAPLATFRYERYVSTPLPLATVANRAFADAQAGDNAGGWTDQGPSNDLSPLAPGRLRAAGVEFDILDAAANAGKSCLVLSASPTKGLPASATLAIPERMPGAVLYLLHATAETPNGATPVGAIEVTYADGSSQKFDVKAGQDVADWWSPAPLPNGAVGWTANNRSSLVGLYVSKFKLESKAIRSVALHALASCQWMIAGLSLSPHDIAFPAHAPYVTGANADWKPFDFAPGIRPGSVFDFSALNDSPAGKYGALVVTPDGHFEFANKPGERVKFWGTVLTFGANYLTKEQADTLAERLWRSGYNTVRIHHFEREVIKKGGRSYEIDPAAFDQIDYLFAALKKRGIYINIDLYTNRRFLVGEIAEMPKECGPEIKKFLPLSASAFETWTKFVRAFLTHVNPYTGLSWGSDPALIGICPVNEDSMTELPTTPVEVRDLYAKAFDAWLAGAGAAYAGDRPSAERRFLTGLQIASDKRKFEFIRSLGVKTPLTGANYVNAPLLALVRAPYDYVDNHLYWDHPQFPGEKWKEPTRFNQLSATRFTARSPRALMPSRLFGKPYAVTEINFGWPNGYRAEGGALIPAYAGLQDWDAIYHYQFASTAKGVIDRKPIGRFDIAPDPINLLAGRFSALLFRRGDVQAAPHRVAYWVDPATVFAPGKGNVNQLPENFSQLGLLTQIGAVTSDQPLPGGISAWVGAAPQAPKKELSPYIADSAGDLSRKLVEAGVLRTPINDSKQIFRSETGEIDLLSGAGAFKLVTPRAEAFILPAGQELDGRLARVRNGGDFAAVYLASVDGQPLGQSRRLLLLHLTDALNDKMTFADGTRRLMLKSGSLPVLVRRGESEVTLRLPDDPAHPWKVWEVAPDGARQRELTAERTAEGLRLKLESVTPTRVCLSYEIVAD